MNKNINENHGLPQAQLNAYWMPFTGNRQFKKGSRIIVSAAGKF